MMMVGLKTIAKTLHPRNWLMVLFVVVLFPLTKLITLSNIAYKVKIPAFVQLGIDASPLFSASFKIVYAILVLAEIAVFFSINIYVLQKNFFQSCADSWVLGRRLEEAVLRLVEETGIYDHILIISLYSDSIQRIKTLDPGIPTAHAVMSTWKDYADVEDADKLSAEIGTITPLLVHQLHEAGMDVFCWTADDPSDIQYLVSCGVDVIGTDDPVMVNTMLERSDCSGGLKRGIHLLMHMLADMVR